MKPCLNLVVAMDQGNNIGHEKKVPWGPLPTDFNWYLSHATTTKDPLKRVALILGRVTFMETILFDEKYLSRWHFIVISRQTTGRIHSACPTVDRELIDVVNTFEQAALRAKELIDTPSAMVESAFVFGGAGPYEEAIASKLVKRIYLTRILAEFPDCDTHVENFDLKDYHRICRPAGELLAELDDKIIEENGLKYQFQVYERTDSK